MFGPRRDEVTGGWRKLHNEELHNMYSSLSVIRMIKLVMMRWSRYVARTAEKRNLCRALVIIPEEKRPLRRPRCRWVHFSTMDL
jgi:hypothetical protein